MRTLLAVLTALMLFATPVVAGDMEDGFAAYEAGDHQKAFRLFKAFAEQGHAEAQYNLGWMYSKGEGVLEDDVKAVYWYRKAADQGFVGGHDSLEWMYKEGEGVPQDYVQASAWFSIAAAQWPELSQSSRSPSDGRKYRCYCPKP
jgi:TPR repeat protein|tara:strand:- start:7982 stop:8416 length:435 start_codon:yes stop_codon:yes gene_type:complete